MLKAFVDASVVLELLLERARTPDILNFFEQDSYQLSVSPLTIHLAYYFGMKVGITSSHIKTALQEFDVLTMDAITVRLAQNRLTGRDFEDCLQAAVAEQENCDLIITLDQKFKQASGTSLKVLVL